VLGDAGPGAINLLLGTADATTNSTPLIALSAQVGMNRSFKESHQGVDLVSMFTPVTKWSALVATPGAVPEMIRLPEKAELTLRTELPVTRGLRPQQAFISATHSGSTRLPSG
jgi:thiamine pyrophosphate-dependent acetolactate synthase large subunit-like protein